MDKININSEHSLEIISEIMRYMNSIEEKINCVKEKIQALEKNNIWNSENSVYFSSKCFSSLDKFAAECEITNEMVKSLIVKLENYREIDRKVVQSLNGDATL